MVPVSLRFDTAGPLAKSSRDVALFLDVLVDASKTQVPPEGYISCAKGASTWENLRVGVLDPKSWLYADAMVGWPNATKQQIVSRLKLLLKRDQATNQYRSEKYPRHMKRLERRRKCLAQLPLRVLLMQQR